MLCVNNFKIWTVHCMNYQLRCSTSCSCTYHRRQEVDFWPRLTHICTCFKHLLDIGTLLHLADLISNPARKSYKDPTLRFLSDQIRLDDLAILRFPGCLSTNHSKNWHMHRSVACGDDLRSWSVSQELPNTQCSLEQLSLFTVGWPRNVNSTDAHSALSH